MEGITIFAIAIIAGLPGYGLRCGAGTMLLTTVLLGAGGLIAAVLAPLLASHIDISGRGDMIANEGLCQVLLFLLLFLAAIVFGISLNRMFEWTFGVGDKMLALLIGLIAGCFAAHMFLHGFFLFTHGLPVHATLAQSPLIRQFVGFEGWHQLVNWVSHVPGPNDTLPTSE